MHLGLADKKRIAGGFLVIKEPPGPDIPGQQDPAVVARVSTMLSDIEKGGLESVRRYAQELDGFSGDSFEVTSKQVDAAVADLPADLREALDVGASRTRRFAEMQRSHLTDFEAEVIPGVVCGQKYVPVRNVGAYLPAGRFPLLASAFMTIGVARAAGVPNVVCCTPPASSGRPHPAVLYAARASGAEAIYVLGGVQALAAMAFGLLDGEPADMIVGAGNAYVAEAKRQLFGRVGIDLLAGPTEIAIIADETADPPLLAADLLGQAEHGPATPAVLITTSREVGEETIKEVDRWLAGEWPTKEMAGEAWRNRGEVILCESDEEMVKVSDEVATEHLEVQTKDPNWFLERLTNYGSLFLGEHSTVAYSDKAIGTNHVLPTNRAARYTGGLWVGKFTKTVTYQKVTAEGTEQVAPAAAAVADGEFMLGHALTCRIRQERVGQSSGAR